MQLAKQIATGCCGLLAALATAPGMSGAQSAFDFPHQTDFLTAGCFTHVVPGLDPDQRASCIQGLKDRGYTHIYVYAYNENDYRGPSFDFYADPPAYRDILQEITDAGLKPVVWLHPDDAPVNRARTVDQLNARMSDLLPFIDDLVSSYVLGLELDEYWPQSKIDALGQHLDALTDKTIAVHQIKGRWNLCRLAWCDYMMLQYGFGKTANEIKTTTGRAIDSLDKPVVAAEYSKSDGAMSATLGDAAVSVGARGFGNGGTPGRPSWWFSQR